MKAIPTLHIQMSMHLASRLYKYDTEDEDFDGFESEWRKSLYFYEIKPFCKNENDISLLIFV